MRTGTEVTSTTGTRRGVVVDGHVAKTGPNRGRLSVIWIGGNYPVAEYPADLVAVAKAVAL